MFQRYSKKKKEQDDEYMEKDRRDKGQDEDGHFESERDMSTKQKRRVGGKFFQSRYDNDSDDEKMYKYDETIEDNADEDSSSPILSKKSGIARKEESDEKSKEKRKKVIAIIIKKGMRNRNK